MLRRIATLDIIEQTKPARVIETDYSAVIERQHDVVVGCVRQVPVACRNAAGHAEVKEQQSVRIELDEDVFPAAADLADPCSVEARRERRRKRPAQIGPAQFRAYDAPSVHL